MAGSWMTQLKKEAMKKMGIPEKDKGRVAYPTGFHDIDLHTLTRIKLADGTIHHAMGVRTGGIVFQSGTSGTGKTSFAFNMAYNILNAKEYKGKGGFDNGWIEYFATEDGMDTQRMCEIIGVNPDEYINEQEKIRITPVTHATTEAFEDTIKLIHQIKMEHKDVLSFETISSTGEIKEELAPTVLICDSITSLFPEELVDLNKDAKNTIYMHQNNKNGAMVLRILKYLREANIIIIFISHVSTKTTITGMPPARKWKAISGSINIKGGETLGYQTDLGLYFNKYPSGNKLQDILKSDDSSYVVEVIDFKNRFGVDGWTTFLVNNGNLAFEPVSSTVFKAIFAHEFFKPAGSMYKLDGWEEKFYKKDISKMFVEDPKFKAHLIALMLKDMQPSAEAKERLSKLRELEKESESILDAFEDDFINEGEENTPSQLD